LFVCAVTETTKWGRNVWLWLKRPVWGRNV